jgi:hypothetical protein
MDLTLLNYICKQQIILYLAQCRPPITDSDFCMPQLPQIPSQPLLSGFRDIEYR